MTKFCVYSVMACVISVLFLTSCSLLSMPPSSVDDSNIVPPEFIYGDESDNGADSSPVYNFGGRDFTIAMFNRDLFLPEKDSSPVSNKILERNDNIQKELNIKITALEGLTSDNFLVELDKRYNSGLFCGDLLVVPHSLLPIFVSQKKIMSVKSLPFVDLTAECYDTQAVNSATIGNFVHGVYGDLTYMPDKSVCVFFNKDIANENIRENLYSIEKNGQWTWDNFISFVKSTIPGINAAASDKGNFYGLSTSLSLYDTIDTMWASCGQKFFDNLPPNIPKMNFNTEKTQIVIDKIRGLLYNKEGNLYVSNDGEMSGDDLFVQGNALFCIATLDSAQSFSDAGINFGILPLPKYDENAPYSTYVASSESVCVLNNIPDSDFTGIVLQRLAETSSFNNADYCKDYYVTNFLTDNSSAIMLDKIFKNPYYDLSFTLGTSYPEIAAASYGILHSNLETGVSFDALYDLNNRQFDSYVKTNFTYKGE